ncbi:MAG: hypothetical protein DA329_12655 [Candidatus Nitrosocosmicus sp.]|nr:hypothetical protein [Candidatus Nitrosocosmicus sp.]
MDDLPLNNFTSLNQVSKIKTFGTKYILIIVYVFIAVLSFDTIIYALAGWFEVIDITFVSPGAVPSFVVILSVTIVCQLFIMQFVRNRSREIRKKNRYLNLMHHTVTIIQYFIIAVLVYVILGLTILESYSMIASTLIDLISYGLATVLMGIFGVIFLRWYKSNRKSKSILVLIYGLSFVFTAVALLAIMVSDAKVFEDRILTIVTSDSDPTFPGLEETPYPWKYIRHLLFEIYSNADLIAFYLKWGGTAMILYHYAHKMGKLKFWTLLSLPLIYFSLTIIGDYHLFGEEFSYSLIYISISSLNSTWGGILFYIAFRISSKQFESNERFRNYLLLAGFGFMLFFSGSQTSMLATVYPPWGAATTSTFGLGTYVVLMGLYLSAKAIAQNEELKESLKKSTLAEYKFLHSIGTSAAEREKILIDTALAESKSIKEEEMKEVGIAAPMSEKEIREFVKNIDDKQEAMEEEKDQ